MSESSRNKYKSKWKHKFYKSTLFSYEDFTSARLCYAEIFLCALLPILLHIEGCANREGPWMRRNPCRMPLLLVGGSTSARLAIWLSEELPYLEPVRSPQTCRSRSSLHASLFNLGLKSWTPPKIPAKIVVPKGPGQPGRKEGGMARPGQLGT